MENSETAYVLLEGTDRSDLCQNQFIPEPHAHHPLVRGQLFFTLPESMLKSVIDKVGAERFDLELVTLEVVLSRLCGDHAGRVGFWGGRPIPYTLLQRNSLSITPEQAASLGWQKNPAELQLLMETGNRRLDRFAEVARGYCGWLLLNPSFRKEHRELFEMWKEPVSRYGIPQQEVIVEKGTKVPKGWRKTHGRTTAYAQAFEQFFIRWRLAGLAAPFLPNPLPPQFPLVHLRSVLGHMRHGGSAFYLPDTFPVPSRDELREILEDAANRPHAPEYLQEWQALVRANNPSKTGISRYARLFELQHFWRALQQRHTAALDRCGSRLEEVFASFLGTSPASIHKDLGFLAEKLGDEWALRD